MNNNTLTKGRDEASMYDVTTYTDKELLNILDLDAPTDRELEAKIIFLINKYRNIQNTSGDQLADFFEEIYKRFFISDETEIDEEEEEEEEGFTNIREGISNQDVLKLTTTPADKVSNVSNTTEPNSVINVKPLNKANADEIGYTKSLEYTNGKLNPLLKQTVKRIISIDSQYRDNKASLSTEFTFNLSDPLKDVVSLKLYSVQIPYTWYTINNNFGSNFFVLKGNVPGINNGNHDYQIEIAAGNYSPQELTNTINTSIETSKTIYTDVSFGNTALSYNSNTSLITTNIDLYKQYNETSYYVQFPETWDGSENLTTRLSTIPGFLGFKEGTYTLFQIESQYTLPLSTNTANEQVRFTINSSNNYISVYKYIGDSYDTTLLGKNIDLSWNVYISADNGEPLEGSYTRSQITAALNTSITKNEYIYTNGQNNSYSSGIERVDVTDLNYSYFILKIKPNRYTTRNLSYSKIQVKFPVETGNNRIWTGDGSCFQFHPNSSNVMEMNDLISEVSPLQQSDNQYRIQSSPYINLVCNKTGYDVSSNNYKINVSNSTTPYNLTTYIAAINNGFKTVDNSNNFTQDNTYVQINNQNTFTTQVDLTKYITTSSYKIDLSSSFLHTDLSFASSYNLNENGGVYITEFTFKENYTIPTGGKLAVFSAGVDGKNINSSLKYEVVHPPNTNATNSTTPYLTGLNRTLQDVINQQFTSFIDVDGVNILTGTNLLLEVQPNNKVKATLTISITKQLTESDYSIQFLEGTSDTLNRSQFTMDLCGGVISPGYYVTYNNGTYSLSEELLPTGIGGISGILDLSSIDVYDLSVNNTFTHYINTDTSYNLDTIYNIDASYIAFFKVNNNAVGTSSIEYGKSVTHGSTKPHGYLIPSPTIRTYTNLNTLIDAMNSQFRLFPDLSGTIITRTDVPDSLTRTCTLTVGISQNYNQDTWFKSLNVSRNMIDSSYNLLTNAELSYSKTNDNGSVALGIQGTTALIQNVFACTEQNNSFELIAYEEGVSSISNNITFRLPLKNPDQSTITYTRARLITEINNLFEQTVASGSRVSIINDEIGTEYTQFRITVNKEYTSKDYNIVYYDPYSFVKCFSGVSSVRNVTWDTTLGWILGYRESTIYDLSESLVTGSSRTSNIIADTGISTNLFNYFLITLDDYNQNHLNDGLVTITTKDTDISLPSYANRTKIKCDPVTGEKTYNTTTRTDYSKLTRNQIYAITQIANSANQSSIYEDGELSSKNYGSGPFAKDVFGIIPLKLSGLQNGSSFVEFGGTLQNQERVYFGPVNIHRMSVKLVSDRGNVVDLNGANWSFSLICEQLYRPQQTGSK